MTPETLSRVFDLYAQDSAARDRSEGGLGIGLALVEALVRLHQGSVTAHSDGQGRGSEFTVRLPLFRSGEPGRPQDSA
jgi:signal transduction histidine kinase